MGTAGLQEESLLFMKGLRAEREVGTRREGRWGPGVREVGAGREAVGAGSGAVGAGSSGRWGPGVRGGGGQSEGVLLGWGLTGWARPSGQPVEQPTPSPRAWWGRTSACRGSCCGC